MNRKQRHLGRELALLWLFQIDVGQLFPAEAMTTVPDNLEGVEDEGKAFARELVEGIVRERPRIDNLIIKYSKGWSLDRIASIDRNVLRIALYEILYMPDTPTSVSIDEAVEIAKHYSTDESGKFVNGILGAFMRGEYEPPQQA